ncbi:MAG TPA: hypothetical protein VLV49_14520 [Terriglobales bacterium]|nr:hypothetical protein [Terriglobales bacterium]
MEDAAGNVRVIPVWFYLGIGLYIASFFLHAVNPGGDPYAGWQCALVTLKLFPSWGLLPGLINPLILAFIVLSVLGRLRTFRLVLASTILLLLIPTWLLVSGMQIMLGCAMWVVSLPLIMSGDLGSWKLRLLRG